MSASEEKELLDTFHDTFGETALRYASPSEADLARLSATIPVAMIDFWREHGWCSYLDGLLWTTNPEQFSDVKRDFGLAEQAQIIGRSGFGDLLAVMDGKLLTVFVHTGRYSVSLATYAEHIAYGLTDPETLDDIFFGRTYREAVARDGTLKSTEMFTFEPTLALGGSVDLKCVKRVSMKPALAIVAQMHEKLTRV